jgi:hypothetical protein
VSVDDVLSSIERYIATHPNHFVLTSDGKPALSNLGAIRRLMYF